MSDTTPALDEAFERMAAASFELPNGFVNHGAMACEALAMLDCTDDIGGWARRFARAGGASVDPTVQAGFEWRQALGDYRRLPEWIGYSPGPSATTAGRPWSRRGCRGWSWLRHCPDTPETTLMPPALHLLDQVYGRSVRRSGRNRLQGKSSLLQPSAVRARGVPGLAARHRLYAALSWPRTLRAWRAWSRVSARSTSNVAASARDRPVGRSSRPVEA